MTLESLNTRLVRILLVVCVCVPAATNAAEINCTGESSLSSVISCVKSSIQPKDTELYSTVNDEATHSQFYSLIQNITERKVCEVSLPSALSAIFKTKNYIEDSTTYCIIYTYQDVNVDGYFDDGHGVYIINMEVSPAPLSVVVPHPLYDTNTPALGIEVFSSLKGHVFSIAGAHRHTNDVTSLCQSSYKAADSVHNIDNFFFTFHRAIHDILSTLPHVQFHSMGSSTCPGVDVFISSGFSGQPNTTSPAMTIINAAATSHPEWDVAYPEATNANGCNLYGTGNTIGRMMNAVPTRDVCTVAADKSTALASSIFVQVELKWDYRSAVDWIPIMTTAFPRPAEEGGCTSFPLESGYR